MGKFKVGDWVSVKPGMETSILKAGAIYQVTDVIAGCNLELDCSPDPGHAWDEGRFIAATEELATLRAFREQALARYPDLAEPESDEDAVERLVQNYYENDQMADELVRGAIAWARANPRQG